MLVETESSGQIQPDQNKQQKTKRRPNLQYAKPDDWAKSGAKAMMAARMLCEKEHFNYACYVGQEALELYVKAFLLDCKPSIDLKCMGHRTWHYIIKTAKERIEFNTCTKQIKSKEQILSTFDEILNVFESKIEDKNGKQLLWLRHMSNPNTIKNDEVLFLKQPYKIKNKLGNTIESIKVEPLYAVTSHLVSAITGEDMTESIRQTKTCSKLEQKMLEKIFSNKKKELVREVISLLCSIYWLPTICAAYIHQQYARYPEKILASNQSESRISNTCYNLGVTQALLDRIECTINEIKTHLQ